MNTSRSSLGLPNRAIGGAVVALLVMTGAFVASSRSMSAQSGDYVIGPRDVLTIAVFGQADLTGRFTVGADGAFTFPLIGSVRARGLTPRAVEQDIAKRLADGLLRNPQVTVTVEQYSSQAVFVVGEVRQPGSYPLTGDTTMLAVLARAGSITAAAAGEVLVLRSKSQEVAGPVQPEAAGTVEVMRVDLNDASTASLSQNLLLQGGDTIFVPKAENVFVFGQVRSPGAYPIRKHTTVLQALSLAGGLTEQGSTSRLRLVRMVDGKETSIRVNLTDTVKGGDTIVVPERFF
jgi:polysaccharide export outer membrane protein